jgi:putative transferase (TIGR04331 family)
MISQTLAFIRGLAAPTRLRIRTHQGDALPLGQVSTTSGATLLLDDLQESGTIAASHAKLVLHNYLSTAWLETMALNIPTVCFYDPEIYSPRDSARPYIDALAKVGVIHYSGIEAAKFVNGLNEEPSAWWLSTEVQEAREAFVARYANFSENWLPAWMEEFERLLAE